MVTVDIHMVGIPISCYLHAAVLIIVCTSRLDYMLEMYAPNLL